jgi:hypothetical protein
VLAQARRRAGGDDDSERGQKARDDAEEDRRPYADGGDEGDREERPADRAEVVHRPLEPVGAPVGRGRHEVGEQGVAGWNPQPSCDPAGAPEHPNLPHRRRGADQRERTAVAGPAATT